MTQTKICNTCQIEKPLDDFYRRNRNNENGKLGTCKPCWKIKRKDAQHKYNLTTRREKYSLKKDKINQNRTSYHKKNPLIPLLTNAKNRARKKGLPFDLEKDDIIIPEYCPVLGIKLESGIGKGKHAQDNSPSLDKFIPEKGYVKGNVQVMSYRANRIKNDASLDELKKIVTYLECLQNNSNDASDNTSKNQPNSLTEETENFIMVFDF